MSFRISARHLLTILAAIVLKVSKYQTDLQDTSTPTDAVRHINLLLQDYPYASYRPLIDPLLAAEESRSIPSSGNTSNPKQVHDDEILDWNYGALRDTLTLSRLGAAEDMPMSPRVANDVEMPKIWPGTRCPTDDSVAPSESRPDLEGDKNDGSRMTEVMGSGRDFKEGPEEDGDAEYQPGSGATPISTPSQWDGLWNPDFGQDLMMRDGDLPIDIPDWMLAPPTLYEF